MYSEKVTHGRHLRSSSLVTYSEVMKERANRIETVYRCKICQREFRLIDNAREHLWCLLDYQISNRTQKANEERKQENRENARSGITPPFIDLTKDSPQSRGPLHKRGNSLPPLPFYPMPEQQPSRSLPPKRLPPLPKK